MPYLIILIFVAIIAIFVVFFKKRNEKLMSEGKIIQRKTSFWEEAEYFITSSTFNDIAYSVKSTDLSDCKVSIEFDSENRLILFKSSYSWNAAIQFQDSLNGKNLFKFSFPAYRTRNGVPYRIDTMNVMQTAVEKILLSLDPQTTVETHRIKYNTK